MSKNKIALAVLAAMLSTAGAQAQSWNPFGKGKGQGTGDALQAVATEVGTCKAQKELKKQPERKIGGIPIPQTLPSFRAIPPLCIVETPNGILVITAEMLDEA